MIKKVLFLVLVIGLTFAASAQKKNKKAKEPKPTHADVSYGKFERNKIDFWQAQGEGPRPIYIHIHGGGWVVGDKNRFKGVQKFLDKGISVAAINYRFTGTDPLPAPVLDAARAVQFLRYKASEWNINKNKFVLSGGSAGACTSMWIACHDDLAKPNSEDPVERESTRVQGISVAGGQSSIDPKQIEPWIGPNVYHEMIYKAVGEKTIEDALKNYAKHEAMYKEYSAYNHLSKDDPPMLLSYGGDMTLPSKSLGHGIHHGMFGVKMKEKSDALGHNKLYLSIGKERSKQYPNRDDFVFEILLGK
jgi:arylformamidase